VARVTAALILALFLGVSWAGLTEDLESRGIPATSASLGDTVLHVEIVGSLAEGDSLLKHYGGIFYLAADSVAAGWPVVGLEVGIDGAFLRLSSRRMLEALQRLREGLPEEQVARSILDHTFVVSRR
jgi:hypothetical protein